MRLAASWRACLRGSIRYASGSACSWCSGSARQRLCSAFWLVLGAASAAANPACPLFVPLQVDDSRATLAYATRELLADIAAEEGALAAQGRPVPPTRLGVFVLHNKQRPKAGALPEGVPEFVAQVREVPFRRQAAQVPRKYTTGPGKRDSWKGGSGGSGPRGAHFLRPAAVCGQG